MSFFHPNFTTLQRYVHLSALCEDSHSDPFPSALVFRRSKQISSHVGQERKTPTNTPPTEQTYTNTVDLKRKSLYVMQS